MNRSVRWLLLAVVLAAFAVGCNSHKDVTPSTFAPPPKTGPQGAQGPGGAPKQAPQVQP
jgi:hypothetical protein